MSMLPGLEPIVPPRSLQLDAPVWGLDVSTRRIALAVMTPGNVPHARAFDVEQKDRGPARLVWALNAAVREFEMQAGELLSYAPALIFIEAPFAPRGQNAVHPQSHYMLGVVQMALFIALGSGAKVELIDPMSWKRQALGAGGGGAGKARILRWAREWAGYAGDCPACGGEGEKCDAKTAAHDEADAIAICTAAGVTLDSRPSEALR